MEEKRQISFSEGFEIIYVYYAPMEGQHNTPVKTVYNNFPLKGTV